MAKNDVFLFAILLNGYIFRCACVCVSMCRLLTEPKKIHTIKKTNHPNKMMMMMSDLICKKKPMTMFFRQTKFTQTHTHIDDYIQ